MPERDPLRDLDGKWRVENQIASEKRPWICAYYWTPRLREISTYLVFSAAFLHWTVSLSPDTNLVIVAARKRPRRGPRESERKGRSCFSGSSSEAVRQRFEIDYCGESKSFGPRLYRDD